MDDQQECLVETLWYGASRIDLAIAMFINVGQYLIVQMTEQKWLSGSWATMSLFCRAEEEIDEDEQKPKKRKYTRRKQLNASDVETDTERLWTKFSGGSISAAMKFLNRLAVCAMSSNMQPLHPSHTNNRAYILLLKEKVLPPPPFQ